MRANPIVGDLVAAFVDHVILYRILDEIKLNHLGQVCYRFSIQWYSDVPVYTIIRVGDQCRCRLWIPEQQDPEIHSVQVSAFTLTYNSRVALVQVMSLEGEPPLPSTMVSYLDLDISP